jgi:hypothetical protein
VTETPKPPTPFTLRHLDATPGEYSEADASPYFWHNGQYPDSAEYLAMQEAALLTTGTATAQRGPARLQAGHMGPGS